MTKIQGQIVAALTGHHEAETAAAIAAHIGCVAGTVGRACETLRTAGILTYGTAREGQQTFRLAAQVSP